MKTITRTATLLVTVGLALMFVFGGLAAAQDDDTGYQLDGDGDTGYEDSAGYATEGAEVQGASLAQTGTNVGLAVAAGSAAIIVGVVLDRTFGRRDELPT